METLLTGNIWKQVIQQARTAKRRLVAVAYVSSVKHLRLRQNDILVCDASDHAIETGATSAHLLHTLSRRGVELRSQPSLHAKVAVFGQYALIGSCNLSTSSEEHLTELALFTNRQQVVAQAAAFIYGLREASEEIDSDFLDRILNIRVHPARQPRRPRKKQTPRLGNRVWLVSVRELAEGSFPKEQPLIEETQKEAESLVADRDSTVSWIRWTGKARFRSIARPGDRVVQIWRPLSGKCTKVCAPCPLILRKDVDHWTRFWLVEPEDCHSLSWKQFERQAKKRGLSQISQNSVRELNPREVLLIEGFWK